MEQEPLVTVVIPAYNRAKIISRPIESVLEQEYRNWELLLIDDRSTDNTKEVVDAYSIKDSRIRYLLNTREKGPSGARNMGIVNAKGKYIAFLDSDDQWMNHHLKESISVMEEESINVTYALWIEKTDDGEFKYEEKPEKKKIFDEAVRELKPRIVRNAYIFSTNLYEFTRFDYFYYFQINTLVINKDIIDTIGLFDENIMCAEDMDFGHRLYANYETGILWSHHFYYYQGNDNLYFFSDRASVKTEDVINNKAYVERFSMHVINDLKYIRKRLLMMKKMTILNNKKESLRIGYKYLVTKLLTAANINKKLNKPLAIKCCLQSLRYSITRDQFILIGQILLPFIFDRFRIKLTLNLL